MSHAELPQELVDLVIGHLLDRSDLLACALVCRAWIPIARSYITITVDEVASFIELVQAPTATFPSTTSRLDIILLGRARESIEDFPLIVPILPRLTVLRSLKLSQVCVTELPPLPTLTALDLWYCEFVTCAGFIRSLSALPRLRDLTLWATTWGEEEHPTLPPMHLDSVFLHFPSKVPHEEVLLSLNTTALRVVFPVATYSPPLIPRYLRHLGGSLKKLHLGNPVDIPSRIDFTRNTGLQHLEIDAALATRAKELRVSLALQRLLPLIAPHCMLRTLTLHTKKGFSVFHKGQLWTSAVVTELLNENGLEGLDELRVVVPESAVRSRFNEVEVVEVLVREAIPRATRARVVCFVAGKIITRVEDELE